jgi:AraC-like DNA-binding protein
MKSDPYAILARSSSVRSPLRALGTLTGLSVKLMPFVPCLDPLVEAGPLNPLCRLVARTRAGRTACAGVLASLQSQVCEQPVPCVRRCFAGLTKIAVPIVAGGVAVAMLVCGYLPKRVTPRDFNRLFRRLEQTGIRVNRARARRALAAASVISPARLRAAKRLLILLSEALVREKDFHLFGRQPKEPVCAACGKAYAQAHFGERASTRDAACSAQVSEPYFCRAFKTATGLTFSEYVARCRVERAKELLANPALRVTEAAFAAGFQSIPHFNHAFKHYTGTNPTAYRTSLRTGRAGRGRLSGKER